MESFFGSLSYDTLFPVGLFLPNQTVTNNTIKQYDIYRRPQAHAPLLRGVQDLSIPSEVGIEDITTSTVLDLPNVMAPVELKSDVTELAALFPNQTTSASKSVLSRILSGKRIDECTTESDDDHLSSNDDDDDDEEDNGESDLDSETELDRAANEIVMNESTASMDSAASDRPRRGLTQSLPMMAVETVHADGAQKRRASDGAALSAKKAKISSGQQVTKKQAGSTTKSKERRQQMDKRELKKMKNREAAARCRNRRKQLIDDLSAETAELKKEMAKMQEQIDKLRAENKGMQIRAQSGKATCSNCQHRAAKQDAFGNSLALASMSQLQFAPSVELLGSSQADQLDYFLAGNLRLPFYQPTEDLANFVQI